MRWGLPFLVAGLAACSAEADFGQPVEDTCHFKLEFSDLAPFYPFDLYDDLVDTIEDGWVRSDPILENSGLYFAGSCSFPIERIGSDRGDLRLMEIAEDAYLAREAQTYLPLRVVRPEQGNER